jgi:hypothetical protein
MDRTEICSKETRNMRHNGLTLQKALKKGTIQTGDVIMIGVSPTSMNLDISVMTPEDAGVVWRNEDGIVKRTVPLNSEYAHNSPFGPAYLYDKDTGHVFRKTTDAIHTLSSAWFASAMAELRVRQLARSKDPTWLDQLMKFTPIFLILITVLLGIVVFGVGRGNGWW